MTVQKYLKKELKDERVLEIMAEEKTLLDQWRGMAYNEQTDKNTLQKLWIDYFRKKKKFISSF